MTQLVWFLQLQLRLCHKMPEGPELHLAGRYVNKMCNGLVFTGAVRKSDVSKSPDVSFTCEAYRITATSRGKEVKVTLTPLKSDGLEAGQADQPMDVVFRFGMSGHFRLTTEDELPKHSHLRFYTNEKPCRVLSFVDARRFGSWQPGGAWQPSRGPCIITEYTSFRSVAKEAALTRLRRWPGSDPMFLSQGERPVAPVGPRLRQAHLWSPAQSEVLQWYRQLPEGRDSVQVTEMHNSI